MRGPYERNEITKEEFKQILKKTADKARSPQPPPSPYARARALWTELESKRRACCRRLRAQVIGSYRKEGIPPPANFEIVGSQRVKIQKLVEDYVAFIRKRDS